MSRSEPVLKCFLALCILCGEDSDVTEPGNRTPPAPVHTHYTWIIIANTKCLLSSSSVCTCGVHMQTVCAHEHICQRPEVDVGHPALLLSLSYSFETGSLAEPLARLAAGTLYDALSLLSQCRGHR